GGHARSGHRPPGRGPGRRHDRGRRRPRAHRPRPPGGAPMSTLTTAPDPTSATAQLVRRVRRDRSRRALRRTFALGLLVAAAFVVRVTLGDYTITVPDTLAIIGGADIPGASFILMESKLPRAIAAVLA